MLKLRIRTTPRVITEKAYSLRELCITDQLVIIEFWLLLVLLNGSLCVYCANGIIDSLCSTDVFPLSLSTALSICPMLVH